MTKTPLIVVALLTVAVSSSRSGSLRAAGQQAPAPGAASAAPAAPRATLDKYCVTCHNDKLKTAGLMLDQIDVNNVGGRAETFEKVLLKLRAAQMPPSGAPRPPKETYAMMTSWLEKELDRASAQKPNPGRTAIHRLNRTEYQNVIRDLFGLEVDASLLPGDDAAYGFDNIADLLKVSPDLLDSYLTVANKVSRFAVGDKALSLGSASYNLSKYYTQVDRADEDLPLGSRGGAAIHHYAPYDGEYTIRIQVVGLSRPVPANVEVRVDDVLVATLPTTGRSNEAPMEQGAVETRVNLKAGPRVIGVSLRRDTLEAETRFPALYPWGNSAIFGTTTGAVLYMKIASVDVAGPFNPAGPG